MSCIAAIGARIKVSPWDDVSYSKSADSFGTFNDRSEFEFLVEGWLKEGESLFGLYGPVLSGPERYRDLTCTIITRADDSNWQKTEECQARFYVGPSIGIRDHNFRFENPNALKIVGFPNFASLGAISVVKQTKVPGTDQQVSEK